MRQEAKQNQTIPQDRIWEIKRLEDLDVKTLYEIIALRINVFILEQACFYEELDHKDYNATHLYTLDDKGKVRAYLRILDPGTSYDELSIGRVLVAPSARGTGLGRELMLKALSYITEQYGEVPIRISAQAYLQYFYESLGFTPASEIYLEDGIEHLEMVAIPDPISAHTCL